MLPLAPLPCSKIENYRCTSLGLHANRIAGVGSARFRRGMHELSPRELQITGLVATDAVVDVLPENGLTRSAVASLTLKPAQDRLVGSADDEKIPPAPKSTKTAEAAAPTDEVVAVAPAPK